MKHNHQLLFVWHLVSTLGCLCQRHRCSQMKAPYRIRTDPYCLEGSRAKPLTLMVHMFLGPQRVELCVSAYKTDAQWPSSTSPKLHSTKNLYRTSYSAGSFSLMKLSGYCVSPLFDLHVGHGLHHPLSSSFEWRVQNFNASKCIRFCQLFEKDSVY